VNADGEQLRAEARRQCERLLEELGRQRREFTSPPGRLAPEVVAAGVARIDAAVTAATRVLQGLKHDDRHP
jgi:hypothetical protein